MKTLYIFCFDDGNGAQSDAVVGDIDLSHEQMVKLATDYISEINECDPEYFEITEIYPVSEDNIKLLIDSRREK